MSHYEWVKLSTKIIERKTEEINCPNCNSSKIDYQYVGDIKSRIGFLNIWCCDCLKGINISRVKAPDDDSIIDLNEKEKFEKRVPKYELIN